MLHNRPVDPFAGSDALLVVACKLFQDRIVALDDALALADDTERDPARQAVHVEASHRASSLLTEWQELGRVIAVTPAHHPAGRQAKVKAFHVFVGFFGAPDRCLAFDFAWSIVTDLIPTEAGNAGDGFSLG